VVLHHRLAASALADATLNIVLTLLVVVVDR
jgi:hypothetical protein